jgi:tetratricopeptide (TPR) repeat protein
VEGSTAEIPSLVDQLTIQLLGSRFTEPTARMAKVATTTTSSLPALKAFLEGESLRLAGQFLEAVQAYQRAVAADSTFALAWLRLFETVDFSPEASTSGVDQEHAIQQAMRYRHRLPARDRMNIEATNLSRVWTGKAPTAEDLHEAERLMRSILDHHPDDAEAWRGYGIGLHFFAAHWGRSLQESRQALERAVELGDPYASGHLVGVYAKLDLRAKADSIMREGQVAEGEDFELENKVEIAFSGGNSASYTQLWPELRKLGDSKLWWCNAAAGHWSGRPYAEYIPTTLPRLMTAPKRSDRTRTYGHLFIALMHVARGQWQAAGTEIDSARTIDPQSILFTHTLLVLGSIKPAAGEELVALREDLEQLAAVDLGYQETNRLFLTGLLDCRLGNIPAAAACAETLAARAPSFADLETRIPRDREALKLAHILRAEVAAREGNIADALTEIEQSPFYAPRDLGDIPMHLIFGYERFKRAEWLAELDRPEEALRWYDTLAMSAFSGVHEMVYIAPAHLRRAELHDQRGQTEQAIYNYRKFIEIWSDCDPELRTIVDAVTERLASLQP